MRFLQLKTFRTKDPKWKSVYRQAMIGLRDVMRQRNKQPDKPKRGQENYLGLVRLISFSADDIIRANPCLQNGPQKLLIEVKAICWKMNLFCFYCFSSPTTHFTYLKQNRRPQTSW